MDTRLAAHADHYSSPRSIIRREPAEQRPPPPLERIASLGVQTSGLDQGLVGAVNASRITSMQTTQPVPTTDRTRRIESPAQLGYRLQSHAIQPTVAQMALRSAS